MPAYVTVTLRLSPELVADVDRLRGGESRNAWIVGACEERVARYSRAAVERALGEVAPAAGDKDRVAVAPSSAGKSAPDRPAPAEQPDTTYPKAGYWSAGLRSSGEAKRFVEPYDPLKKR